MIDDLTDEQLREATERDMTRTRPRPGAWTPPVIVEHWPCKGCSVLVGMTKDAIDLHAMFNRQLERRREPPLTKRALCPDCKRRDEELVAAQRRPHEQTEMPLNRRRNAP